VSFVAGMMPMERHRFQIANFLSALVRVPVVLSRGWLVGKGGSELH
jgi:membrane protein DedA with SNARE-associated domain